MTFQKLSVAKIIAIFTPLILTACLDQTMKGIGVSHTSNSSTTPKATPTATPKATPIAAATPTPTPVNGAIFAARTAMLPSMEVGTTFVASYNFSNSSNSSGVTVSSIALSGAGAAQYSVAPQAPCNSLPTTLSIGQSCMIKVTVTANTAGHTDAATLTVNYKGSLSKAYSQTQSLSVSSIAFGTASSISWSYPAKRVGLILNQPSLRIPAIDVNSSSPPAYTFAMVDDTALQAGLSFDSSSGAITGTPTAAATVTHSICAVVNSALTTNCNNLFLQTFAARAVTGTLTVDSGLCTSTHGTGTTANPIQISTANDMDTCVRNYPDRLFKLMNNVDLSSITNFEPLPNLTGGFDGNGYALQNWTWDASLSNLGLSQYVGLFQGIDVGVWVHDLTISNATVTASGINYVGILTGSARGAVITNVAFSNINLTCGAICGALAGFHFNPSIVNNYSDSTDPSDYVDGYYDRIYLSNYTLTTDGGWARSGGIIGTVHSTPTRISRVSITGTNSIPSGNQSGPVLGATLNADWGMNATPGVWIDSVSVTGFTVADGCFVGGIVGWSEAEDSITNSYSTATVNSTSRGAGGISGFLRNNNTTNGPVLIANSYFKGTVTGSGSNLGVLLGETAYRGAYTAGINVVNTRQHAVASLPLFGDGTSFTSNTNVTLSDANFLLPANFSTWGPEWLFSNGSVPSLNPF